MRMLTMSFNASRSVYTPLTVSRNDIYRAHTFYYSIDTNDAVNVCK